MSRPRGWGPVLVPDLRDRWAGLVRFGGGPADVARSGAVGPVYLATPFSRPVAAARASERRAVARDLRDRAAVHVAMLAREGVSAISPIVLAASACDAVPGLDPLDQAFWTRWCAPLLRVSSAVVVPDLPGWGESEGVRAEVIWALEHQMPVHFYSEAGL